MSPGAGAAGGRLASPATWAGVCGGLLALLAAAMAPLYILAGGGSDVVTALVIGVPTVAVGVIVARRQPRNPLGWLLLAVSACLVLSTDGPLYALLDYQVHGGRLPYGQVGLALNELWGSGLVLFGLVVLLFPDGRLPSARWRWPLRVYLALCAAQVVADQVATAEAMTGHRIRVDANGGLAAMNHPGGWYGVIQGPLFLVLAALWLSFVGRQAGSWRHSSGERRQQLKWLMSGAAVCLTSALVAFALTSASGLWQVVSSIAWFGFAALPIGIGVGILKYRLYEIDRIISRTLAYAVVTGLLVGLYAALVLLATQVLSVSSSLAVAGSTLVAAALFNVVRRRVQQRVDRRFNRARYDAEITVAAFAARLQDAVDLDAMRADLAGVVHAALAPAHVSVWVARRGPG
jgi:hypothetical protein